MVGYDLDQDLVPDEIRCGSTVQDCALACSDQHVGDASALQECVARSCRIDNCAAPLGAPCQATKACVDANQEDCFLLESLCEALYWNPGQEDQNGNGVGDLCEAPTPEPIVGDAGKLVVRNLTDTPDPFDADVEPSVLSMDVEALELPGSKQQFDFTRRVLWQIQSPWTGEVVRTLMSEVPLSTVGVQPMTLAWDGRSEFGIALPDGTYYYQVRVDLVRRKKGNSNNQHNLDTALSSLLSSTITRAIPIPGPDDEPPTDIDPAPVPDLTDKPPYPKSPLPKLPPLPRIEPSAPVGAIPATFTVTPDGKAQYTVPIPVPPGRAGLQPDLALVYRSDRSLGPLGVGWSMSGLSSIQRCGKTVAQDGRLEPVKFSSDDRFCLDGERLVAVNGQYGKHGTEYRTERESYAKIVSYGEPPTYFVVWRKSGHIQTYGCDQETMERGVPQSCSALIMARNGTPRAWALRQTKDRSENYVLYNYQRNASNASEDWNLNQQIDGEEYAGEPETIEYYPTSIQYTGKRGNLGQAPQRSVEFTYGPHGPTPGAFAQNGFYRGIRYRVSKFLKQIRTYGPDGELVTTFNLQYGTSSSRRPILQDLEQCDRMGACLPKTYFEWDAGNTITTGQLDIPDTILPTGYWINALTALDVNGDGIKDLLYHREGAFRILIANRSASLFDPELDAGFTEYGFEDGTFLNDLIEQIIPMDLDLDGREDLIIKRKEAEYYDFYYSAGDHFTYGGIGGQPKSRVIACS
jgi:hypothetical protein